MLLDCFQAALVAVDARRGVLARLEAERLTGRWHLIAIGKAAGAMALGAAEALGSRLLAGLVVTKPGHVPSGLKAPPNVRVLESAHPEPDERTLAAGAAVVEFVAALPEQAQILFLVSGGASSLVECLRPGLGLEELHRLNRWALASGRPIGEVNALRRAVSRLKGGGLAALAAPRRMFALFISDVPRDDPAVIGSGLLHAGAPGRVPVVPGELAQILARAGGEDVPAARVPEVPYRIVASVRDACRAAARRGEAHGLAVRIAGHRFSGDAARLGRRFAHTVLAGPGRTLHVWGGESTMTLPAEPGYGGRNQHLALSAAQVLEGRTAVLLAAGTDGVDGVTADAGAIVDGGTCERGALAGLDAARALARADSGRFLEAAGDLLHTGPTLTNVGDIVLGVSGSRAP